MKLHRHGKALSQAHGESGRLLEERLRQQGEVIRNVLMKYGRAHRAVPQDFAWACPLLAKGSAYYFTGFQEDSLSFLVTCRVSGPGQLRKFTVPTTLLTLSNRQLAGRVRAWCFQDIRQEHGESLASMRKLLQQAELDAHRSFKRFEDLKNYYATTGESL